MPLTNAQNLHHDVNNEYWHVELDGNKKKIDLDIPPQHSQLSQMPADLKDQYRALQRTIHVVLVQLK